MQPDRCQRCVWFIDGKPVYQPCREHDVFLWAELERSAS